MVTDERLRASDYDRDHVVNVLRDQYVQGRLTIEEFEERTGAAVEAKTIGELRRLTIDLPSTVSSGRSGGVAGGAADGRDAQGPPPSGPVNAVLALPPAMRAAAIAGIAVAVALVVAVVSGDHILGVPAVVVAFVLFRCFRHGHHGRAPFGDRRGEGRFGDRGIR